MSQAAIGLQIVFSEHHWIGSAEENPEELPMPLPSTLQQAGEPPHPHPYLLPFFHCTATHAKMSGESDTPTHLLQIPTHDVSTSSLLLMLALPGSNVTDVESVLQRNLTFLPPPKKLHPCPHKLSQARCPPRLYSFTIPTVRTTNPSAFRDGPAMHALLHRQLAGAMQQSVSWDQPNLRLPAHDTLRRAVRECRSSRMWVGRPGLPSEL